MQEEAGLDSEKLMLLGSNYDQHRRSTAINYVYMAANAKEITKIVGDEEEFGTELHWFSQAQVLTMIVDGVINQKNALAALALYLTQHHRNHPM